MFTRLPALRQQGITWEQFAFQFIIVLVGVWAAIIIGERANRAEDRERARDSLRGVLSELEQDENEIREILRLQTANAEGLAEVARDARRSVADTTMERILFTSVRTNRTMFPRRAAYSMMVSSGQLQHITDANLRLQLAEIYDHDYVRIMTNGNLFDQIFQMYQWTVTDFWDFEARHRIGSPALGQKLSNVARRMIQYSVYYRGILTRELDVINEAQAAIQRYIDEN